MTHGEVHPAPKRRGGTGPSSGEGLTWRGQAALVLLAVHVVLLLLPPLPPYWKGSVWDYALGYAAVVLAVLEVARRPSVPIDRWRELTPARRVVLLPVLGAAVYLWRRGRLRPSAFGALARSRLAVWLPSALALVALAVAEEARFLGVQLATPSPEELIEAAGAVLLACFAREVAADSGHGTDRTGTLP